MSVLALNGCEKPPQHAPDTGPQEVGVVTLHTQPFNVTSELTGRVVPVSLAEVRPQVGGIIEKRLFTEGEIVQAGQPLYKIESSSYAAAVNESSASLMHARAQVKANCLKAQRYRQLLADRSVSRQDADDAIATCEQNRATVQEKKAALDTSKINLRRTTVTAPISGRIGISTVTAGALVTAEQQAALATIRDLDSMYVDLTRSSAELLRLKRQMQTAKASNLNVSLTLPDGKPYQQTGRLALTEVAVNESTGSVTLRAVFPNPDHLLLPGMYVTARVNEGRIENAILAPQQGVTRDSKGNAVALVVNKNNHVEQRHLQTGGTQDDKWLIYSGLSADDRLIVQGTDKVSEGSAVLPVELKAGGRKS
nr:efflux RND transporter periplasmic adaptor subunit [Enterobacter sp. E105B]